MHCKLLEAGEHTWVICLWLAAGEQVWGVYGWKQVNAPRQEFPVAAARCVGAPLLPPPILTYFLFLGGIGICIFCFLPLFFIFSDGCGTFSYSLQTDEILTFKLYKCPYVSLVIN